MEDILSNDSIFYTLLIGFLTLLFLVVIFNGAVFFKAISSKREQVYQFLLNKSEDPSLDVTFVQKAVSRFRILPFIGIFVFIIPLMEGMVYLWLSVLILFSVTAYLGYSLNTDVISIIRFKKRKRIGWNLFSWNIDNFATRYYSVISILGMVALFLAPLLFVFQTFFISYITSPTPPSSVSISQEVNEAEKEAQITNTQSPTTTASKEVNDAEENLQNIKPEESFVSHSNFTVTPARGWYLWEGVSAGANAARNFNYSYATSVLGNFILLHSTSTEIKNRLDSWNKGFNEGKELIAELQEWEKVDSEYLVFTNSSVNLKNRDLGYVLSIANELKKDHGKYGLVIIKFEKTVNEDYRVSLVSNRLNNERKEEFIKEDIR